MPMSDITKERLKQARLAKRARKDVRAPITEPIVTTQAGDEWIEVTIRIKRSSDASGEQ